MRSTSGNARKLVPLIPLTARSRSNMGDMQAQLDQLAALVRSQTEQIATLEAAQGGAEKKGIIGTCVSLGTCGLIDIGGGGEKKGEGGAYYAFNEWDQHPACFWDPFGCCICHFKIEWCSCTFW